MINYETDFYGWTQEQGEFLRQKLFDKIDWENIAEMLEDMGRSEKRQLESRLEVLIMHLLKWKYQPNLRSRSWQLTIKEQRIRLEKLLRENPSLKAKLGEIKQQIYPLAVIMAEKETGLSVFPEICPFEIEEILGFEFFPEK
jgi:hypothetical protein